MKRYLVNVTSTLGVAIAVTTIAGCAGETTKRLSAVAPDPVVPGSAGYLVVNSATEEFNDGETMYYPHSRYTIYTKDGHYFKTVRNHLGKNDENAEHVSLPAGSYIIHAQSETDGSVEVPVIIAAGQTTNVELDRNGRS